MPRGGPREEDPEEDDEPAAEADDEEPSGPPRRRRRPHRGRSAPKAWRPSREAPEGEEEAPPEDLGRFSFLHRPRRPTFFRATDTWWFEPLVALAIVVLLLVSLYAYTQNWPPVYVVESNSMQHGSADQIGLLNTGDLVLAAKLDPSQIVPYTVGAQTGYRTYGEFGDVVLYHPDGDLSRTLIIHRAILEIDANSDGTYSIPSLSKSPCGSEAGAVYRVSDHANGCGTSEVSGTLTLYGIGWQSATVNVALESLGHASGFLTMGDNNFVPGSPATGIPDEPSVTSLVQPAWIVGVARGMLPWFGSLKLLLTGTSGEVPAQSWEWMGLTVIVVLLGAMGVHYALRAEGIEDERRRELEHEEEEEAEEEPHRRRWRGLLPWRASHEDDEEEQEEAESRAEEARAGFFRRLRRSRGPPPPDRGRPPPKVRRGSRPRSPEPSRRRRRRDGDERL